MAITSNLERKKLERTINNLTDSLTRKEILSVNNNTPFFYKFLLTNKNTEWSNINSNLTEDFNYISEYEAILPYENSDSYKNDWNYHPIFTRLHVYKNENVVLNEILLLDLSDLTNENQKLKLIENVYNFGSNSVNFSFKSLNNDGYYELDFTGNDISLNTNTTVSYSAQVTANIHLINDDNYNKILLSENTSIESETLAIDSNITLFGVINDEFDKDTFETILDLVEGIVSGVEYTLPSENIDFSFLDNRVACNSLYSSRYADFYDFTKIVTYDPVEAAAYNTSNSMFTDNIIVVGIGRELSSNTKYQQYHNNSRTFTTSNSSYYNNYRALFIDSSHPYYGNWIELYNRSTSSYTENKIKNICKISDAGQTNQFGTNILLSINKKLYNDKNIYIIRYINRNNKVKELIYSTDDFDTVEITTVPYYQFNQSASRYTSGSKYYYYYPMTFQERQFNIYKPIEKNKFYSLEFDPNGYSTYNRYNVYNIEEVNVSEIPMVFFIDNSYAQSWTNPNGEGNIEEILKGSQTNKYFIPQENQEKIAALESADLKDKPYDSSAATIQTLQQVIANLQSQINDILNGNLTINATLTTSGYFDIKMPYFKNILKTDVTLTEHQTEGTTDYYTVEFDITPLINLPALSNFEVYKPEIDFNDSTKSYFDETTFEISDSGVGSAREIKLTGKCSVAGYSALQNDSVIFDEVRIYMRAIDNTIEDQSNEGGE